jgi:hypothetical protein
MWPVAWTARCDGASLFKDRCVRGWRRCRSPPVRRKTKLKEVRLLPAPRSPPSCASKSGAVSDNSFIGGSRKLAFSAATDGTTLDVEV